MLEFGRRLLMNWQKLYNPIVISLLRSPLHSLIDKSTILITLTGRKSGKKYTIPVSYIRDGDKLLMISQREHSWWKNLRGGAQLLFIYKGTPRKPVVKYSLMPKQLQTSSSCSCNNFQDTRGS